MRVRVKLGYYIDDDDDRVALGHSGREGELTRYRLRSESALVEIRFSDDAAYVFEGHGTMIHPNRLEALDDEARAYLAELMLA